MVPSFVNKQTLHNSQNISQHPMAAASPASPAVAAATQKRQMGAVVERGVVYGTEAIALYPKQTPPEGTPSHRWKVYVRGPRHEDISYFVKKVVFHLHTSFSNPHRSVESPPFEITEQGWGEFDIIISIHFKDPSEKPIDVTHSLKLFPPANVAWPDNKPVVAENIDQIVFNDPTEWFYKELMSRKQDEGAPILTPYISPTADEDAQLEKVLAAQKKIREEIWKLKEKYEQTAMKAAAVRRQLDLQEAADARSRMSKSANIPSTEAAALPTQPETSPDNMVM